MNKFLRYSAYAGLGLASGFAGFIGYKATRPVDQRLNLVFDMDHTLLHAIPIRDDFWFQTGFFGRRPRMVDIDITTADGKETDQFQTFAVWNRPFVLPTLKFLSIFNNIHLYTKALKNPANGFCKVIEVDHLFITRHYRESTVPPEPGSVSWLNPSPNTKDLSIIKKPIELSVLIDDQIYNQHQNQNFYQIKPYFKDNRFDFGMIGLLWFVLKANVVGL